MQNLAICKQPAVDISTTTRQPMLLFRSPWCTCAQSSTSCQRPECSMRLILSKHVYGPYTRSCLWVSGVSSDKPCAVCFRTGTILEVSADHKCCDPLSYPHSHQSVHTHRHKQACLRKALFAQDCSKCYPKLDSH